MNDTLNNKLISFKAALAVADDETHRPMWQGKKPRAFENGLTAVRTKVAGLASKGAVQSQPTTGDTATLRNLRKVFEAKLLPLARGTYRCLLARGDRENAAKVDFTPSDLHNARAQALAGLGETVLDLAEPLSVPPAAGQAAPGDDYGIDAAAVAAFDELWERYSTAVGAPISARSKRKALTEQLPDEFRAVEAEFSALDDLIIQFDDLDSQTGAADWGTISWKPSSMRGASSILGAAPLGRLHLRIPLRTESLTHRP